MAGYLIGGRFLTGEITLRRVVPKAATVELTLNAAESIRADPSLPMTDPATGMSMAVLLALAAELGVQIRLDTAKQALASPQISSEAARVVDPQATAKVVG